MTQHLRAIVGAGLIAFLSNILFFRAIGVTGMALFLAGITIFVAVVYQTKKVISPYHTLLFFGIFSILLLAITRATPILSFIFLGSTLVLGMFLTYLLPQKREFFHGISEILLTPFIVGLGYVSNILEGLMKLNSRKGIDTAHPFVRLALQILLGCVIAVPLIGVLMALFISADPIFASTIEKTFGNVSVSELGIRILGTCCLFLVILPLGLFSEKKVYTPVRLSFPEIARIPIMVVLFLVALTLGLFLFVQWPYIFAHVAKETELTAFGVATYSEYVKRGFVELLLVASLLYSTLWVGLLTYRGTQKKRGVFLIQTILALLFSIFILSVARRILLYWDFHGLSLVRVYGGMFLIWVSGLTFAVWLRHLIRFRFVLVEVFGTILFVGFLGVWNAEHFIVHHHPPTVNNQIDYVYLSRLSADGYDGWSMAYTWANDVTNKLAEDQNPVIGKEQRREFAYAGMVVSHMTKKYDSLIRQYGSDQDRQRYTDLLFTSQLPKVTATAQLMQASLLTVSLRGSEATTAADAYIDPMRRYEKGSVFKQTAESLTKLSSESAQLLRSQTGDRNIGGVAASFIPRSRYEIANSIESGHCSPYYSPFERNVYSGYGCVPSFYLLSVSGQSTHSNNVLDRLLVWNASEMMAYKKLQQEIPITELLSLHDVYFDVLLRIASQSAEERKVDWDISLDAPFLQ